MTIILKETEEDKGLRLTELSKTKDNPGEETTTRDESGISHTNHNRSNRLPRIKSTLVTRHQCIHPIGLSLPSPPIFHTTSCRPSSRVRLGPHPRLLKPMREYKHKYLKPNRSRMPCPYPQGLLRIRKHNLDPTRLRLNLGSKSLRPDMRRVAREAGWTFFFEPLLNRHPLPRSGILWSSHQR